MTKLESELRDAWEGEGNSSRISFPDWLKAMAENDAGTLQEAAKEMLAKQPSPESPTTEIVP